MAMPVVPVEAGVDVAKDELVIQSGPDTKPFAIPNTPKSIKTWLKTVPRRSALAIEATSSYHMELAEQAHGAGLSVYVVDGLRLSRYRDSLGVRAKTDANDATLLARFLNRERASLKMWVPAPPGHRELQMLLRRRAKIVEMRGMMRMSLSGEKLFEKELEVIEKTCKRLERLFEMRLREIVKETGLRDQLRRLQQLPGVGFLTAVGLTMSFIRGEFANSDAFVAYLGMDVITAQSGKWVGRGRLSKRGDSEVRRLLHNAAMSGSRTQTWKQFYAHHLERGKKTTQALVILSRKMARLAYGLMKSQTDWKPQVYTGGAKPVG
ncbi:IS110 family transposase [Pseudomonas putida CSV86]|uniref:IS110 family transposase n=1 Tax=Pseudomonas bharatica CSV86 TaxID=1005395 RepID=L1M2N3_9PSED|nr:IS110 family transposase [Pseudomonas bharatica]NNJ15248.1 IS110 family transposase [Pseudomonas bharatica CSV86]NNJ17998.1 IS110 family transposase [Pseudomonas bharatica CSV86]NNJ19153.1 IS110 family transposase [Pseudomonas bharatica CSV86]